MELREIPSNQNVQIGMVQIAKTYEVQNHSLFPYKKVEDVAFFQKIHTFKKVPKEVNKTNDVEVSEPQNKIEEETKTSNENVIEVEISDLIEVHQQVKDKKN